jgi:hypothetical protein
VTDAFEEVEESLRRDKATEIWNRIYPWLLGALALLIAGVGGWEIWKWQRAQAIEKDAEIFAAAGRALDAGDRETSKKELERLAGDTDGFGVLANQSLAAFALEANDAATAEGHLARAAEADDKLLGSIATLKLGYLKADTASLAELNDILAPVIKEGGQAGALARELVAAKMMAEGGIEKARAELQALNLDLEAPQQMKLRVQQVLMTLPKAPAAPTAAAPAPAATTPTEPIVPAPATPAQPGQPNQ